MKYSDVKQNIVETASFLFYKNGYNSTGINEIIAEANIAKATLYNHFKSKEEICIAYLKYKNTTFLEDISEFASSKKSGITQILSIFDFLQLFFKDKDFNGCWCIKTVAEIPRENQNIRSEIIKSKSDFIKLISELVETNLKEKSKKERTSIAKQIYLLYEGAVAESHLHQKDWPIKEAKNLCVKIIQ